MVAAIEFDSTGVSAGSESVQIDANIDDADSDSDSARILYRADFVGDPEYGAVGADFPRKGEDPDDIRRIFLDTAADSVEVGFNNVDTAADSVEFSNGVGPAGRRADVVKNGGDFNHLDIGFAYLDTGSANFHSDAVIVITDSFSIGANSAEGETMSLGAAVDSTQNGAGSDLIGAGVIDVSDRSGTLPVPSKVNGFKAHLSDA